MKDEKLREEIAKKELEYFIHRYKLTERQAKELNDIVSITVEALIKTREIEARKDELLKADGFTEAEYTVKRLAQLNKESTQ